MNKTCPRPTDLFPELKQKPGLLNVKLHKTVQKEKGGFEKQTKQIFMELSRETLVRKQSGFHFFPPNVMILKPDPY